ncbi:hypothetical protein OQA88_13123 [Cercophora sp. LCS_1]
MGHPPAFLFVVRHGLRLDAADKQWHLSSPTPYDPPLTYIGWQQAKNLGVRIGNIIRERVAEEEAAGGSQKRKRYRVVLHSSPFLRCVQTAIAISAGLAQDSSPFGTSHAPDRAPPSPILSPRSRPTVVPDGREACPPLPKAPAIRKSVLRLDAFLGEWLSPGYFELITPPPESVMMLASSKADLLRREDYASYPNFAQRAHSNSQGQLWSPTSRPSSVSTTGGSSVDPLDTVPNLASSLQSSLSFDIQSSRASSVSQTNESVGYVSPVPHWAVNNNNTIPPGYVSHARDACLDIDYQWDSMRSPLDWGDGGSFPEEWTEMHRRFRKGVQHLVDWYSTVEKPTDMVTKMASRFTRRTPIDVLGDLTEEDDVETEAIVILVSHGAGCNALIGAITHQPVLMDVAMASLTMAVRKPVEERAAGWDAAHHPRGWASPERKQDSIPIHQLYDLKIFASTDHLRSPPTTPSASRTSSVASVLNGGRAGRPTHSASFASSLNNFTFSDGSASRTSSANAALSSLRRGEGPPQYPGSKLQFVSSTNGGLGGGITVGSGVTSFGSAKPSTLSRTPSIGLWSPLSAREEEEEEDEDDGMVLNFSHEKIPVVPVDLTPQVVTPQPAKTDSYFDLPSSSTGSASETPKESIRLPDTPESASDSAVADGLWGSTPMPPDEADALRDTSSTKRRWTVTDRN